MRFLAGLLLGLFVGVISTVIFHHFAKRDIAASLSLQPVTLQIGAAKVTLPKGTAVFVESTHGDRYQLRLYFNAPRDHFAYRRNNGSFITEYRAQ